MIVTNHPLLYDTTGNSLKLFSGNANAWSPSAYAPRVNGHFYLDSTNNKWKLGTDGNGGLRDTGSNFELFKSEVESTPPDVFLKCRYNTVFYGYDGGVVIGEDAYVPSTDFTSMITLSSSESQMMADGSTAISRVLPTNPLSDLPTAIGELYSDGAPSIPGHDFLRNRKVTGQLLAAQYLNYTFGLVPLFRDMRAFAASAERAEKLIRGYVDRAGKKIRRRYNFPAEIVYREETIPNPTDEGKTHLAGPGTEVGIQDLFNPSLGGNRGVRVDRTTEQKHRWFSGAFTYHLPNGGYSFSSRMAREEAEMRQLYGGISLDTAWNLLPYSWAADWITNAGDVIQNVSSFARDGLVMPHGYIMEHVNSRTTRTVTGAKVGKTLAASVPIPSTMSMVLKASLKRRRKATPFGFGLDPSGFTTRQWAILAALGMTNAIVQ